MIGHRGLDCVDFIIKEKTTPHVRKGISEFRQHVMSERYPTPHPTPMLGSARIIMTLPSVRHKKKIGSNFPINIASGETEGGGVLHYVSQPTLKGAQGKMEVPFRTWLAV